MEMSEKQSGAIAQIMGQTKCPVDFKCYRSGFDDLGSSRAVAGLGLVECLDGKGRLCPFTVPFGSTTFCKCPLRTYIAIQFNR